MLTVGNKTFEGGAKKKLTQDEINKKYPFALKLTREDGKPTIYERVIVTPEMVQQLELQNFEYPDLP